MDQRGFPGKAAISHSVLLCEGLPSGGGAGDAWRGSPLVGPSGLTSPGPPTGTWLSWVHGAGESRGGTGR